MATRGMILVLSLLSSGILRCQEPDKLNTLDVDHRTYQLYTRQKWDSLISLGNASIEQGINFYYLQYRMGIAWYEKKNYVRSIPYFEAVLASQPDDQTALEYLYYANLYSGRNSEARILTGKFLPESKKRLGLPEKEIVFGRAGAEYKMYRFGDYTFSENRFDGTLQTVRKDLDYVDVYFDHRIGRRIRLFHGISYVKGRNIIYDDYQPVFQFDEELQQYQYYLGVNWHLKKEMDLYGAIHYVHTGINGLPPLQGQGPGPQMEEYLYSDSFNQVAGHLKISWWHSLFTFRGYASLSNFAEDLQFLPGLGVDVYPAGNTMFYIRTDLRWQYAPDNDFFTPGLVLNQKVGLHVWKPIWTEVFYQVGKVSNYVDDDAFVVYNVVDPIDWWFGARVDFYLFDRRLQPYYIFQQYRQTNYYFDGSTTESTGYFTSTHLVGLRWNFNSP